LNFVTFTVEEANKLIPEIRPRMERLIGSKREMERLQDRIEVLTLTVAGATKSNPDSQELGQLHDQRNRLADSISKDITWVHGHGCVVKDLDKGLVDFYALAGDRLVFLCWKLGEAEVSHWHPLDGGYGQRKPLQTEPDD
jgi:hypothetical protein